MNKKQIFAMIVKALAKDYDNPDTDPVTMHINARLEKATKYNLETLAKELENDL